MNQHDKPEESSLELSLSRINKDLIPVFEQIDHRLMKMEQVRRSLSSKAITYSTNVAFAFIHFQQQHFLINFFLDRIEVDERIDTVKIYSNKKFVHKVKFKQEEDNRLNFVYDLVEQAHKLSMS